MDVTDFPLDSQTCQLKFVSLGYRKTEVLLAGGAEGFAIDDFQTNSDWSIVSTNWWTVSDDEDVTIIFQIKIKRNSTYDILTIIVPIMALSVLNLFGFLVPSDSGEKVGYNVTVFLAFAVFFSLIAASLPEALALMVIYLILMTMASAVTCLFAIVQVRCLGFDETGKKVPRLFIYISKLVYGRVCFKKENTNKVDNSEVNINDKKQSSPGKSLQSINDDEDSEKNSSQSQGKESETLTWKEAMNATDLLLLYFFTVYCLLSTIICFGLASG